jgi:hypothetical protein
VNDTTRQKWLRRKRRIAKRLRPRIVRPRAKPMFAATNIHYDMADRTRAVSFGGIGAMQLLVRKVKLADAIDKALHLLKVHLPYHESDHVLNIAYNILCGGTCLQDLELLRNNEAYLDAVGASRIPDPTTAGDFCRRFESAAGVISLMEAINSVRVEEVWKKQDPAFFEQAKIDVDGTMAATDAQCKEGIDISYDGQWGYHPLIVSLAQTKEPLYLLNRPGNRPSHEDAAEYLDRAFDLCDKAGFKSILARGDTDFSQTAHLDRWDQRGRKFLFGIDAMPNLKRLAESLDQSAWQALDRPPRYQVATEPRSRPDNVKDPIIARRLFKNLRLQCEHVAEIDYQPVKCEKAYRLIICRKTIDVEVGQDKLWEEYRYFFFITNLDKQAMAAPQVVLEANKRCNQENLIEQLKNGVNAMALPVNNLIGNWAYMVMASLAWSLKAWWGLMLPEVTGCGKEKRRQQKRDVVRMEFKRFMASVIQLPCQIVRSGRRLVYRLLSYSPWQEPLLAAVAAWRTRAPC